MLNANSNRLMSMYIIDDMYKTLYIVIELFLSDSGSKQAQQLKKIHTQMHI